MVDSPPDYIETERLVVRITTIDDVDAIAEAVNSSRAELAVWMPWASEPSSREQQIERLTGLEGSTDEYAYGAFDKDGRMLGGFGLMRRIGPDAIELGYWLRTDATGNGYATEAVIALTEAALELSDVERVEIHCDEANTASAAIPPRAGYKLDRIEDREVQTPGESGKEMIWIKRS